MCVANINQFYIFYNNFYEKKSQKKLVRFSFFIYNCIEIAVKWLHIMRNKQD